MYSRDPLCFLCFFVAHYGGGELRIDPDDHAASTGWSNRRAAY